MEEDAGSNRVDSSTQANDLEEAGDTSGATVDRNSESVQGSWSAGTFADSDEGRLRREDADLSSSFPGKSSTDNPFTIGGWVYPLDFPNAQRQIVCKGPNDIEIYWEGPSAGTAKFTFVVAGESISVSLGVPGAPQWYLVILRYDKDGVPPWMHASIYADTISWQIPAVIPRGFPIGNPANSDEFSVGARLESVDEFHLNGYVDELFAYDRVLSVWEMDLIWQHGLQTILDNVFILPNPVEMLLADQALNVIPGAVSVPLPTRAMTLTPEVLVVITAEPQIIAMNPATMTLADQPLQVAPGAVGLDMDALGMTVTELPFQVIPGGTTVQLPPRAATLADQPLDVAPGPVALLMNPLEALVTAMTTTVVPGEVTALMDALQAQVVQLALDVVPGAVTLPMQARTLSIGTQVLTVFAPGIGAQFVDMGVVGMTAATQAFTVVPGAVGVNLPPRTATVTAENAQVIPGQALIAMQAAELTISDLSLVVLPGSVSVLLPTRTLLIEDQPPTVNAVTTILMNAVGTTVAPQTLVVVPGAVDVELPAREMTINTEAVQAQLANIIVLMEQLGMTLTAEQLEVVALTVNEHRTIDIYADDRIIRISRDGRGQELT
jgi:hypothetical protein